MASILARRALQVIADDTSSGMPINLGSAVSRLFGWIYFTAWSLSFYPQLIETYRRKSVTGLSVDFFTINVAGFACYTTSTYLLMFSPTIRRQYAQRHPHAPKPTVQYNDLAFGAHAFLLATLMWCQFLFFGYKRDKSQKLSKGMSSVIVGSATAISIVSALAYSEIGDWEALDVVYTISYVKLLITVLKYIPQAWMNYQRKSTKGWSIYNILLDTTGGTLSLAQLFLDSALAGDVRSGASGNPMKLGLGLVTLGFDAIFISQHYYWFKGNEPLETLDIIEQDAEQGMDSARNEGIRGYGSFKPGREVRI